MRENQTNYQADDEIDLLEIVAKLWKKKWTIILLTVLPTLLVVAFALFKMERVSLYKATTTINAYQSQNSSENYYLNLVKSVVSGNKFIQTINAKFPQITIENFQFSFDEAKKNSDAKPNCIEISVVSADQEIVAPVANLAPVVIEKVMREDYADIIDQTQEKKRLKAQSVAAYQENLRFLKNKIEKAKSQEDVDYLVALVGTLSGALSDIEKTSVFDYSKVKILDKAKRPTLSIREEEILEDKRKGALSGKWKSKKVIVLVTFFACLFLSIFLVLALDFIKKNKEKFKQYLDE